jgi:GntR family transcriptional regulator, transcriptional repressor for pyruvate dehydrogenase complex
LAFHDAIASASKNAIYEQVLALLRTRLASARSLVEHVDWVNERAMQDHEDIYNAIASQDVSAARAAMRKHMELAAEAIEDARRSRAISGR